MNIKKGDIVKIIKGKDSGKTGKVLKISAEKNKVTIEGLNLFKKHVKPKKQEEKGEIVSVPRPINASNIMLMCANCGQPTRIGYVVDGQGKTRICKKCKAMIK